MRDLGRQQAFEVIDLREWLDGADSAQVGLDSCHFNAFGHRLLGEHLATYLLEHDRDANPVAAE
jgi:hypothetical protein